jgi:hypothetical protein
MAYATLEILADRVRRDLEGRFGPRSARLDEALRLLLEMLLTARAPGALEELAASGQVRGLRTHLRQLEAHLRADSRLPEALCARYKYKTSEARARRRYRISGRAWGYFHHLAAEARWNVDLRVPLISYEKLPWHDDLEQRYVALDVILDSAALEGMLVCALEAYLSPRAPRRKGYEVYGVNLGMTRDVHRRRPLDGVCITRYVSVMCSYPQLSADGESGFVVPNARSLDAILGASTALHPQYQAVADFHSHPYDDLSLMEQKKGWEYTAADEASNIDVSRALGRLGHHVSVTFVIAVARCKQKVARSHYRGMRNTVQMSLDGCRVIFAAYRSLESGRLTRSNIRLRLPGMAS